MTSLKELLQFSPAELKKVVLRLPALLGYSWQYNMAARVPWAMHVLSHCFAIRSSQITLRSSHLQLKRAGTRPHSVELRSMGHTHNSWDTSNHNLYRRDEIAHQEIYTQVDLYTTRSVP